MFLTPVAVLIFFAFGPMATAVRAATTPTFSTAFSPSTAADGDATMSLSVGQMSAGSTCTVNVQASAMAGTWPSITEDLTSDQGNSGTASAGLVVDSNLLGFAKGFSPSSRFIDQPAKPTHEKIFGNLNFFTYTRFIYLKSAHDFLWPA